MQTCLPLLQHLIDDFDACCFARLDKYAFGQLGGQPTKPAAMASSLRKKPAAAAAEPHGEMASESEILDVVAGSELTSVNLEKLGAMTFEEL